MYKFKECIQSRISADWILNEFSSVFYMSYNMIREFNMTFKPI